MKSPVCGKAFGWLWSLIVMLGLAGCSPPEPPSIGLHEAVLKDNLKAVEQHIAAKTPLTTKDKNGWTPLHLAALRGNLPIAQALVAAGADPSLPGAMGKTPLDLAREQGKVQVAGYLQNLGSPSHPKPTGRGLVDGGLGVSGVLDSQ